MKKLLITLCALMLSCNVFAETTNRAKAPTEVVDNINNGNIVINANSMQKIIEIPNVSKDQIYLNAREWIAVNFRSANSVIQMEDKENGIIIGKGNFDFICNGVFKCMFFKDAVTKFTIKIETKDGRARVTFSDILVYIPPNLGLGTAGEQIPFNSIKKQENKDQIIDKVSTLFDNFQQSMQVNQIDDNW